MVGEPTYRQAVITIKHNGGKSVDVFRAPRGRRLSVEDIQKVADAAVKQAAGFLPSVVFELSIENNRIVLNSR